MHSSKAATIVALLTLLVTAALASGQDRRLDREEKSEIAGTPPKSARSADARENQQQPEAAKPPPPSSRPSSHRGKTNRTPRRRGLSLRSDPSVEPSVVAPITLVSRSPEYLSGEANVTERNRAAMP
jgi:hypothetical protein